MKAAILVGLRFFVFVLVFDLILVKGEEDKSVTAGSLVTVTVILTRRSLVGDLTVADADQHNKDIEHIEEVEERCEEFDLDDEQSAQVFVFWLFLS